MAVILATDPAPFEELISHLMSSSNEQRSLAESAFNLCRDHHPDSLALKLAHLLHSSPNLVFRAMSSILLRKELTRDSSSYLWPRLSPNTQSTFKFLLLSAFQQEEKAKSISKKLCDTVSELESNLLPDNAWPEFLPLLFRSVNSDSPRLQQSSLVIFSQLSQPCIGGLLLPYLPTLHIVFLKSLSHLTSADIRIAALAASINFIQCLPDRDLFQDLLPAMMSTLDESVNDGQEATTQQVLELLIGLAGTEPRFLRPRLAEVIAVMLHIAEARDLEEGTRHLAVEFVITLAEARDRAPWTLLCLPDFVESLFNVLMNMLLDVTDNPAWHLAEDVDAGETSNYSVGQECLDRLSIALGGNTIVPVASKLLPLYLAPPEWQSHHAVLITLAQIAQGCSKVMMKNLEQVVTMVLKSFRHPHPRVRWAAINAIRQLSTDLGPDLQVQYHWRVLPELAAAMDDDQNPRVQAHAASALLNFGKNCTLDILTPYLDGIVSKLLVLLRNGKQMVQESALTALASVADSSQEHFQKYYDAVMPYLKAILMNATDKSNRMLLAKSMECISFVGMAVGKDKFRDDAKQVMEVLMSLQGSRMEMTDDPITSYMLQAWARLCKCLGQDFLPHMSIVMPPLLESAQLKPDVTITSADSDDDIDESDYESAMEKRLALKGDDDNAYDSFDAMNLKKNLLSGIYEYGYKTPSMIQQRTIVPFSKGDDLVVQEMLGPGRTSTFCIGILEQLKLDLHKCQCLILSFCSLQVAEIVEAMLRLGQFMGVKVNARHSFRTDDFSTDSSHVVVGRTEYVLQLVRRKILCPEEIKILVLDEATTLMKFDYRSREVYEIIEYVTNKHKNQVQIGAFYETVSKLTLDRITEEIMKKPVVIPAPKGHELSLEGIHRHMFLYLEEEDSSIKKLKAIIKKLKEIVDKTQNTPIMVLVSNHAQLNFLEEDLEVGGYEFSVARGCMDQKERDGMKKDFLQSKLILTTSLWARDIIEECSDGVRFVVNFDNSACVEDYIWKLGWFRSVEVAITFATSDDWFNLVYLQEEYNIHFERLNFAEFWREKTVKVPTIENETIRPFILHCGDDKGKLEVLLPSGQCSLYGKFDIARLSVIFVKHPRQIPWLAKQLMADYKYEVLIPGDSLIVHPTLPTIFITDDKKFDDVKVKARLVVNFDIPLAQRSFYHRRRCCVRNGIFLLLATDADWCEVFDMQALYNVSSTPVPPDVDDILKEMDASKISHSTSRRPQTRSQTRKRPRTRSQT